MYRAILRVHGVVDRVFIFLFFAKFFQRVKKLFNFWNFVKFIYSEKAIEFWEIFPLLLTVCTVVKRKEKISQNFVAFSEYMNFKDQGGKI